MTTEMLGQKEDLQEADWVKEQTKSALLSLQKEALYTQEGDEVKFDVNTSLNYLQTLKDAKTWQEMTSKNSGATIMAIQILLKNKGYDVGKIDGILKSKSKTTSRTMEAVKQFQGKVGLKTDGIPGPQTLNKLLEKFGAGGNNGPQEPINPQQPTNPETPVKSVELMTVSDLKTFDITKLGKFGKNGFEFIKIKEQSDKKGKYVEVVVNGKKKRIYELGSNQDGVYYNIEFSEVAGDPFRTVTFGEYKHGKKEGRHTEISTRGKSLSKYVGTFKNDKMLTGVILDDNGREHAVINGKLKD